MKIALLSDCYPPRLGGIETQVRDLGRALAGVGHEVHVYTATPAEGAGRGLRNIAVSEDEGAIVHRVTVPLPFDLPVNPLAPRLIRDELAKFDVAHVHMGVISPFATDLTTLALDLGLPTAITWHCVLGRSAVLAQRRLGRIAGWAQRGAALSAVSRMAAGLVEAAADHGAKVAVLPNGIDPSRWAPEAVVPGPRDQVRLMSALRFAPRKRVPALVGMLGEIHAADPARTRATVFGDGPLLSMTRATHRRHRTWLDLPGRVARADLADAYLAGGIYLAPTRMEAFGIAALEARTAGLPVVAMSTSGVADFVIDGVNGLLARDDAGLVAAGRKLVADDDLRERIRAHNLTVAPEQTWTAVLEKAIAEYERAGASR